MPDGELPVSERQTRRQLIDPKLTAAGWKVVAYDEHRPLSSCNGCAIREYPTENGPADYALVRDSRVLGIVEAKKLTLGPQNVLTQAERYSRGASANPLDFRGYHVPFLFSTNGEVTWFHDIRDPLSRSRKVAKFHTPAALAEMLARDYRAASEQLRQMRNDHPKLRPYQIEANIAVEKAIADHRRRMLLAMATGTGKTFTMVNQTRSVCILYSHEGTRTRTQGRSLSGCKVPAGPW
jgi:type I restriction enzyme R subunit